MIWIRLLFIHIHLLFYQSYLPVQVQHKVQPLSYLLIIYLLHGFFVRRCPSLYQSTWEMCTRLSVMWCILLFAPYCYNHSAISDKTNLAKSVFLSKIYILLLSKKKKKQEKCKCFCIPLWFVYTLVMGWWTEAEWTLSWAELGMFEQFRHMVRDTWHVQTQGRSQT